MSRRGGGGGGGEIRFYRFKYVQVDDKGIFCQVTTVSSMNVDEKAIL